MRTTESDYKKLVRDYYSRRAKDYDHQKARTWKSETGFQAKVFKEILAACQIDRCVVGLEVGIGSGRVAIPFIKHAGLQMVGIDLTREMLKTAQQKRKQISGKLDLTLGDAGFLPFRDGAFDLLACISTFHYFPFFHTVLSEFSRVHRTDGIFVYGDVASHEKDSTAFMDKLEKAFSLTHTRYFKPSEFVSLMKSTGYKAVRVVTIPYRKSFNAMLTDKAKYFKIDHKSFHAVLEGASKTEKKIYRIREHDMTLFYTIIVLRKQANTTQGR